MTEPDDDDVFVGVDPAADGDDSLVIWPAQRRLMDAFDRSTHDAPVVLDLALPNLPRNQIDRDRILASIRGISVGPVNTAHVAPSVAAAQRAFREMARAMAPATVALRLIQERIPPDPDPEPDESPQERALRLRQTRNTGPNRNPFEKRTRT